MTYWLKIILYSYVPTIGINLLTRPLWSNDVSADINTNLAIFSFLLTIIILPIYLLIINYFLAKSNNVNHFIINGLIIITCVLLSSYFHFINWADSVGSRNSPDGGTEAVMSLEQWAGSIVAIIGTVVGQYKLSKRQKTAIS